MSDTKMDLHFCGFRYKYLINLSLCFIGHSVFAALLLLITVWRRIMRFMSRRQ